MEQTRKIDDLGRIVLPQEMRIQLGWSEQTPLIFAADFANKQLHICQSAPICALCGAPNPEKSYRHMSICNACVTQVAKL